MSSNHLNIATYLKKNAKQFPQKTAIIYPVGTDNDGTIRYSHKTYYDIDTESDQYAAGFMAAGIKRGTKTIFLVKPGPELFSITFALFKVGAIPVIVDPGLGVKRMLHCYNAVGAEAFIGIEKAHILRLLFYRNFRSIKTWVTVGKKWFWGGYTLNELRHPTADNIAIADTEAEDLALISFTTGSTGPAKGVEYTHAMVDAEAQALIENFNTDPNQVDLATLSLFALYDMLIGITAVLPKIDPTKPAFVDPNNIIDPINQYKVTSMFASPALLNQVAKFGIQHGVKLPSMKMVFSGGAPVTSSIMEEFQQLLTDDAAILTTYGATEALPISFIDSKTLLTECRPKTASGMGTCIGRPISNLDVRIIKITDDPIEKWSEDLLVAPGEVGEIVIKGGIVSKLYHRNPSANLFGKISDGDGVWHRMGDLGSFDQEGRIWFCGRHKHRVNTGNTVLFSVQCEGVFNSHPDVYRSALVGVGPKNKQTPVMCIELDRRGRNKQFDNNQFENSQLEKIRQELLDLGRSHLVTREIKTVLFHDSFPVDIRHNAKIFRELLADWAENVMKNDNITSEPIKQDLRSQLPMLIPIFGWLFIAYGLIFPIENIIIKWMWYIDIFLSVVVHPLQLYIALPVGAKAGISVKKTIYMTIVFGATWWKPLKDKQEGI